MSSNSQNDGQDIHGGLNIEILEQSMRDMLRGLEAKIERRLQQLDTKLKELTNAQKDSDLHNNYQECDLSSETFEICLSAMEKRLEDKIDGKMQSMNEKLREILPESGTAFRENVEKRIAGVETRLESIAEAVGVSVEVDEGDDDADRKRLKEKLKEALEAQVKGHSLLTYGNEKETWMEYIFGICKPNGRMGKRGSRSVHPSILEHRLAVSRSTDVIDVRLIHPQCRFMQGCYF